MQLSKMQLLLERGERGGSAIRQLRWRGDVRHDVLRGVSERCEEAVEWGVRRVRGELQWVVHGYGGYEW